MFIGKGRKGPLPVCAGGLLAKEGVRGPSRDLSLKARLACAWQDYCQGPAGLWEGSSLPTTLLPPSAGASSWGSATPGVCTPTPEPVGRQAGGFSRGLRRVGGLPRARSEAGLIGRQLPRRHCWLGDLPAR